MTEDAGGPAGFEIGKDGLGTIVVGNDDSPTALHAGAWAAGLARRELALLLIVYVEPTAALAYWSPVGMAAAVDTASALVAQLHEQARQRLDGTGIRWRMLHGRGDPAAVLEAVAEQHRADCIVVGRSRRRGGLLGSVPRALLTRAARPVVVVP